MIDDHAIVEREGFKVPLIGVPPSAVLQECDSCHDEFPMRKVEMDVNSGNFYCQKCRQSFSSKTESTETK